MDIPNPDNQTESWLLKHLVANDFNVKGAAETYGNYINFMDENEFWNIEQHEVQSIIDTKYSVIHSRRGNLGRPIIINRVRNNDPNFYTIEELMKYLVWQVMEVRNRMPDNMDTLLVINDFKDAGFSNISMSKLKGSIPVL